MGNAPNRSLQSCHPSIPTKPRKCSAAHHSLCCAPPQHRHGGRAVSAHPQRVAGASNTSRSGLCESARRRPDSTRGSPPRGDKEAGAAETCVSSRNGRILLLQHTNGPLDWPREWGRVWGILVTLPPPHGVKLLRQAENQILSGPAIGTGPGRHGRWHHLHPPPQLPPRAPDVVFAFHFPPPTPQRALFGSAPCRRPGRC